MTLANIARAIADGAQSSDLDALNAKIEAATVFTNNIDSPAEIAGYSGESAATIVKTWLATVLDFG